MSCTRGVWGLPSPSSSANLQRDQGDAAEAHYPSPDTRCDPVCQPKFSPSFHSSDQRGCCRASALSLGWVVSVIPFAENLKQNNQGDPLKFSPGVIHARPFPPQHFEWPYVWVGFPSKVGKLWIPNPCEMSGFGFVLKWISQKIWDGLQNQSSIWEKLSKEKDFCLILASLFQFQF